jgi:hypothetical protein
LFIGTLLRAAKREFKQYWKSDLPINDRTGLVGEFLSQPSGHEKYRWVNWDLRSTDASTIFINVGLWKDAEAFHLQIGQYFNPQGGKLGFEYELRERALLSPACWRMGSWVLPGRDSDGVL